MKKITYVKFVILFVICFIHIISICFVVFSGTIVYENEKLMYKLDNGDFAKDAWVWLDVNNDSIAELYRFNEDGYIAKDYKGNFGKTTNELGQLINGGVIVQKMLSNGEILKNAGIPYVEVADDTINNGIINNKKYPTIDNYLLDNKAIITINITNSNIEPSAVSDNGNVIYSTGGTGLSNVVSTNNNDNIVSGKDIRRYITKKSGCKTEVEEAIVFGGDIWKDIIELRGNDARFTIDLKGNNHIYLEIANESHVIDEVDTNLSLLMYVDGELYDTIDEFVDSNDFSYEETFYEKEKKVEFILSIKGKKQNRRVYIRNGKLKKINLDDEE